MKFRTDFVSNSSSSSFIVISNSGIQQHEFAKQDVSIPSDSFGGCTQFWWQFKQYHDFWSKLNWCAICINDMKAIEKRESSQEKMKRTVGNPWFDSKAMTAMLKKVCKEKFGLKVKVVATDYHSSIDHSSTIRERPENGRMFQTEQMLLDFLGNSSSYIDNGNDNEESPNEYRERHKDYSI